MVRKSPNLQDIHEDAPALYYYNESFVFALTIIPNVDRSDMDITSKLQLETRSDHPPPPPPPPGSVGCVFFHEVSPL